MSFAARKCYYLGTQADRISVFFLHFPHFSFLTFLCLNFACTSSPYCLICSYNRGYFLNVLIENSVLKLFTFSFPNFTNRIITMAGEQSNNGVDAQQNGRSYNPVPDDNPKQVKREHVEGTFSKYAQLIHASQRPLPTQSGDGTYLGEKNKGTSLFQDLRAMGLKGVQTLIAVKKQERSGELVDDRTYLMERVISVRPSTQGIMGGSC